MLKIRALQRLFLVSEAALSPESSTLEPKKPQGPWLKDGAICPVWGKEMGVNLVLGWSPGFGSDKNNK